MIKAGSHIYITKNIKLACGLVTLGHKLIENEATVVEENNQKEVTFIFDDSQGLASADAKKWDAGLSRMDKEEPIAYLWAYAHNRDRMLDEIKKAIPMVRVRYGQKMLLYPKNATAEQKRRIMSKL